MCAGSQGRGVPCSTALPVGASLLGAEPPSTVMGQLSLDGPPRDNRVLGQHGSSVLWKEDMLIKIFHVHSERFCPSEKTIPLFSAAERLVPEAQQKHS